MDPTSIILHIEAYVKMLADTGQTDGRLTAAAGITFTYTKTSCVHTLFQQ